MDQAVQEMSHYVESDYLVVNDDFDIALTALQAIVSCHRLRTPRQVEQLQALLADSPVKDHGCPGTVNIHTRR